MPSKKAGAAVEKVAFSYEDPTSLNPAPYNPRKKLTEEGKRRLMASLEILFCDPVIVNKTGRLLVGGHQRYKLVTELSKEERWARGFEKIPVAWIDVADETARVLNIALNNPELMSEYDDELLAESLRDLQAAGVKLTDTGFDDARLLELLGAPDVGEAEPMDLPKKPKSKTGGVYELGSHVLICGDATDSAVLEAVFGDRPKAEVLWTDPPYAVGYVGKTKDRLTMDGDAPDPEALATFLDRLFGAAAAVLSPHARFYIMTPAGPNGTVFRLAVDRVGWRLHQTLVWVKDSFVMGHSDFHYRHEDVLYGLLCKHRGVEAVEVSHDDVLYGYGPAGPGGGRPGRGRHKGSKWRGGNKQNSVAEVARPRRSRDHPTTKPLDLIIGHLRCSSAPEDVVFDPCGGSGSTMLACEELGRSAALVEISPGYCDVIRERYARFTGETKWAP